MAPNPNSPGIRAWRNYGHHRRRRRRDGIDAISTQREQQHGHDKYSFKQIFRHGIFLSHKKIIKRRDKLP